MADPAAASSFDTLQKTLKPALVATTRTSNALCAEDLPFQRSLDPSFAEELDAQNARLLGLAEKLLGVAVAGGSVDKLSAPRLKDADDLDRNWREVVDVVDSLLERTDGVLDEVRGLLKKGSAGSDAAATSTAEAGTEAEKPSTTTPKNKKSFQQAANILKPQRFFENPPNNFATGPWKPLLTRKPHAKVPLEQSLHTEQSTDGTNRQMYGDTNTFHSTLERDFNASFYLMNNNQSLSPQMQQLINDKIRHKHPYQTEIEEYKYPSSMFEQQDPIVYTPYEETTATYVDTEEALEEMLQELKKAKEIAIDLEHHDQRTYVGIVCLMQISTRNHDWIVDTLKPWRRRLECLNEVFTDPAILKVLHGSAMDVIWLQRDLGLYLVGVFDTEHAATALHYPKRSLAFLLEKWVNFQAQKQYQLADWRVRPLTKELFDYARSDTHFLLYIFDCMRNELLITSNTSDQDGDLIDRVLRESKRYSLQRYETPFYDAENGLGSMGWYKQLFRTPALLSKQQFAVFKAVHQWRDNTARSEDESLPFVMSNHLLQTLAREMPVTKENVLAVTPPYANLVRQNAEGLVAVIRDAKERGVEGLEMREALARSDVLADQQHNNRVAAKEEAARRLKGPAVAEVEAVVDVESTSKPSFGSIDVADVKANGSTFWGNTLEDVTTRPVKEVTAQVRLSLPMPEVAGELFHPNGATATPAKTEPATQPAPVPTAMDLDTPNQAAPSPSQNNDIFVLRDKSGKNKKKRKHDDPVATSREDDTIKAGADQVGINVDVHGARREDRDEGLRAERKKRKREQKAREQEKEKEKDKEKAKLDAQERANGFLAALGAKTTKTPPATSAPSKQNKKGSSASSPSQQQDPQDNDEEGDEEPFDYANAPSVLGSAPTAADAKRNKKKKGKKGRMEGLDPYKKATDAPKGLPRGQRERVGMGGTFRS